MANMMSGNLPGWFGWLGTVLVRIFLDWNNPGRYFPGENYHGWEFYRWELSGWELSLMGIFRVGVILNENCPGGSYLGWEFSGWELSEWGLSWVGIFFGESFPGGNFPVGIICVAIFRVGVFMLPRNLLFFQDMFTKLLQVLLP